MHGVAFHNTCPITAVFNVTKCFSDHTLVAEDEVEKLLESETEEVEETSTKSSTGNNPNLRVEDS